MRRYEDACERRTHDGHECEGRNRRICIEHGVIESSVQTKLSEVYKG